MTKNLHIIGKPIPKLDANIRATGEATYGHDIQLPNMLYGAILRAKYPFADIMSIDTSKAKLLEGVKCVITADDIDVNNISYKRDHPILKKSRVNCIRDEIAAVAATSKEIAQKALGLIEVKYDVKQGIFDPFEALKEDAPQINIYSETSDFSKKPDVFKNKNIAEHFHYEHGDLEEWKAKSNYIVSRRYSLPRVTHCCMATSNITADYSITEGRLTLYSTTQVPFLYQRDIARALKMEPSKIRIIQVVIGGGFGSKLDMYPYEPICALLSMKCGDPVQIIFSREEEFIASPTRQPMIYDITAGADENGKFTFRDVSVILDNGAYTSWGATTPFVMMQTFSSLYRCPACRFDSTSVYTNNVYAGSFRGYGNPQATFALERTIDLLAEEIGISKSEIRLLNANYKGEVTGQGLHFNTCGHKEALEKVIEKVKEKRHSDRSEEFNANSGFFTPLRSFQNDALDYTPTKSKRYKDGIGFASMLHVGGGAKIYPSDGCGTTLKIDPFGYLTIITGSSEIGQGSETVLAMIASEELGIDMSKIKVINTDTDIKPWDVGVHASRTSFVAGNSVLGAVRKLKERISAKAAEMLNIKTQTSNFSKKSDALSKRHSERSEESGEINHTLKGVVGDATNSGSFTPLRSVQNDALLARPELLYENGLIKYPKTGESIELDKVIRAMHFKVPHELCIETYFFEPGSEFADKEFKGNISDCYAFAAQAVVVEVDTYTGNVKVLDVYVAQDVGKVLNPLLLGGQIEGGVVMGMGYALLEELVFDNGIPLNPNFHNYKIPTAMDIPGIHFYPIETGESLGPYGAKGVGEAPLIPTAAAIANAVSDAIGAQIDSLPITPEKVLRALEGKHDY